jgi:hypothetical protein
MSQGSDIPKIYRIWHLYIEPVIAIFGAYTLHSLPELYFESMPRTAAYAPTSQLVYTQLAASYFFLATVEALVLRSTNNTRVWRAVILALTVCDAGHVYATVREVGIHGLKEAGGWRATEWTAVVATIVPLFLRIAFLLGIGFEKTSKKEKRK